MAVLILGLILFIGVHLVKVVAPEFREEQIKRLGANGWRGLYSLSSLVGLGLVIYGYSLARAEADQWFIPPDWGRSLLLMAMPVSLILMAAAELPVGYIKSVVRHPSVLGIVIWSCVHLIGNGDSASALLFITFFIWSLIVAVSSFRRPHLAPETVSIRNDAIAVVAGIALTMAIILWLHEWIIGVPIL